MSGGFFARSESTGPLFGPVHECPASHNFFQRKLRILASCDILQVLVFALHSWRYESNVSYRVKKRSNSRSLSAPLLLATRNCHYVQALHSLLPFMHTICVGSARFGSMFHLSSTGKFIEPFYFRNSKEGKSGLNCVKKQQLVLIRTPCLIEKRTFWSGKTSSERGSFESVNS